MSLQMAQVNQKLSAKGTTIQKESRTSKGKGRKRKWDQSLTADPGEQFLTLEEMDAIINEVELLPPLSPLPRTPPTSIGGSHDCPSTLVPSEQQSQHTDARANPQHSGNTHATRPKKPTRDLAAHLADTPTHTALYVATELQHLHRSNTKLERVNVALATEVGVLAQQAKDMVQGTQQVLDGFEVATRRLADVGEKLTTVTTHLLTVTSNLTSMMATLQDCCEHLSAHRSSRRSSPCSTCPSSRSTSRSPSPAAIYQAISSLHSTKSQQPALTKEKPSLHDHTNTSTSTQPLTTPPSPEDSAPKPSTRKPRDNSTESPSHYDHRQTRYPSHREDPAHHPTRKSYHPFGCRAAFPRDNVNSTASRSYHFPRRRYRPEHRRSNWQTPCSPDRGAHALFKRLANGNSHAQTDHTFPRISRTVSHT